MIDSPAQHVDDIKTLGNRAQSSIGFTLGTFPRDKQIQKETDNFIRINCIFSYYIRLSWPMKMQFMNDLVQRVNSLGTITLLLNTLHSVTGKITSYCITAQVPPVIFDKVLADHSRMLDQTILHHTIIADLQWFDALDDREQVSYLTALVRLSAGAMMRQFYDRLLATYYERIHALSTEQTSVEPPPPEPKSSIAPDNQRMSMCLIRTEHDLNDPKHKKVLELEKLWQQTMTKLKKDIANRMPKSKENQGNNDKSDDKSSKKSKGKSSKKSKGKKNEEDIDQLDWIQLMPIWIVKRIFACLDKATLTKAKKVNGYWKWAIEELAKDKKARKDFDKAHKKLKAATGGDCSLPDDAMLEKPKPRISHTERRMKKLERRGAILEKMRHCEKKATDTFAVITEALTLSDLAHYTEFLQMYPRVTRSNAPLFKRPDYLVKDLNLICETRDDLSDSGCDLMKTVPHASETSLGSDEDIIFME